VNTEITLFEGPKVKADVTRAGILAIHKPVGGGSGFVITHIASGKVVLRTALKREALRLRKELEGLSGEAFEARVIAYLTGGDKEPSSKSTIGGLSERDSAENDNS